MGYGEEPDSNNSNKSISTFQLQNFYLLLAKKKVVFMQSSCDAIIMYSAYPWLYDPERLGEKTDCCSCKSNNNIKIGNPEMQIISMVMIYFSTTSIYIYILRILHFHYCQKQQLFHNLKMCKFWFPT